ncbi:DNA repair protein RAD51-like 3-like isoform 1 [Achlya hypogyna]|uniref:DNA repair protein RAD51 homolog 3 n=1 Tax=Achlya hypogyna TaxID=1202772 RepID=A0A1V9ZM40_ACHHY|nr:DNA repair protein RAD51-like 3-like isoform 1 [Achlya hypogyna]
MAADHSFDALDLASSVLGSTTCMSLRDHKVVAALHQAGFRSSRDVDGFNARELANVAKLSFQDASRVLTAIKGPRGTMLGLSAFDVLEQLREHPPVRTYVPLLDEALGGGVPIGEITEICGAPGVGKTQLAIQIAFSAQCPENSDAPHRSIYIDSEGSFMIHRAAAMATCLAEDVPELRLDRDDLLRGLTYYRVHDFQEQYEVLASLYGALAADASVRAVIVDSIAFHCRHGYDDMTGRARMLHNMALVLRKLAQDFPIAVVLINHVTTSLHQGSDVDGSNIVPALGESWSFSITNRLMLRWEHQIRMAQVVKSASQAQASVRFDVTERGVRGIARKRSRSEEEFEAHDE